ncbi:MAG: HAMP domain-containing sensor histidine kinase [Candidatus Saccharimonadales bacterium]
MAVKQPQASSSVPQTAKPQPLIRQYWPRYHRRAITITVGMQLTATLVIGIALISTGVVEPTPLFWVMIVAIFATTTGLNVLLVAQLMLPFKDLTSALTHVSGEPTIVTPPNPNARHFERDGFKPLLQLIYQLAVGDSTQQSTQQTEGDSVVAALNHSTLGFIVLNADRQVIYANKSAPVRTDKDGTQIMELIFEDDTTLDTWLDDVQEHAVHSNRIWQRVANKIIGEEGRKIYDMSVSYQKGNDAEVVISLFDRSELYQPEDDELDFIAFAAHELRGPITVIRGYLDVLADELGGELDTDQIELLSRLVVSANRLSSYVNNILNASRYDRRHLKVRLREDSISAIYDTIKDDMTLRASSQNRLLTIAIPNNLPTIAADRASASEVLSNLIDNALKYSHEGGAIDVTAAVDGSYVRVSVKDHGIGMPGNVVSNLFHKFYRSHRSRETVAGTGIGLYISKAIVESHGGAMGVKSVEGEGSTFSFTLPIYSTVAKKLAESSGSNEGLINHDSTGWIKNNSMFRG